MLRAMGRGGKGKGKANKAAAVPATPTVESATNQKHLERVHLALADI